MRLRARAARLRNARSRTRNLRPNAALPATADPAVPAPVPRPAQSPNRSAKAARADSDSARTFSCAEYRASCSRAFHAPHPAMRCRGGRLRSTSGSPHAGLMRPGSGRRSTIDARRKSAHRPANRRIRAAHQSGARRRRRHAGRVRKWRIVNRVGKAAGASAPFTAYDLRFTIHGR